MVDCTDDYSSTVSGNLKRLLIKKEMHSRICSFRYTLTAAAAEELRFIPITEKFLNKRSWYVKIYGGAWVYKQRYKKQLKFVCHSQK